MVKKLAFAAGLAAALSACVPRPLGVDDPFADRQKYWDGRTGPQIAAGSCDDAKRAALFQGYGRPELMALGDSLYNGVQSLRINWWLSEWSAPTYVALRLGLIDERNGDRTGTRRFYNPQYLSHGASYGATVNYGFNLERIPFLLSLLDVPRRQAAALGELAFTYRPPNGRVMVDNIAFSGANSIDLLDWTAGDYRDAARRSLAKLSSSNSFGDLGDAFFFSNAYFVLNPTKDACLDELTPLDHVKLRKPKRLIVNIGSNNGVYMLAFNAATVRARACADSDAEYVSAANQLRCPVGARIESFVTRGLRLDTQRLVRELAQVEGLREVYVNGLAMPSQTANLVAVDDGEGVAFESALFEGGRLTPSQLREADALIQQANARTDEIVARANLERDARGFGPRFVFVDVAAKLARYDYKGCLLRQPETACADRRLALDGRRFGLPETQYLDNRPIDADGPSGFQTGSQFTVKVTAGGLFSFDNMHLSTIGYEIMAQAVWERMQHDRAYVPSLRSGTDPCKPSNNAPNDCLNLLTTPGWAFADATRRQFTLARIVGRREIDRRELLKFLFAFVNRADG